MLTERQCKICGKMFMPKSSRRSFCYENHFHPCPICGKLVLTKDLYHLNECCCNEHSRLLATQTTHDRYDVWPADSEAAKEKRKATNLSRYGVENVSHSDEFKKKISEGLVKFNAEHPEAVKEKMEAYFKKTGYHCPAQNPEVKAKVKSYFINKYGVSTNLLTEETKKKADETNIRKYGTSVPMQNHEVWAKQRSNKSKYIAQDGTRLDSTYEVYVYDYCVRNNIPIKRSVPIEFLYEGQLRKTFIDFEIDGVLIEVKGEHMLDGYFDNQPNAVPIRAKIDVYREHNVVLVTGSSASHYFANSNGFKYEANSLIGVDIELFKYPEFPYDPKKPPCFYKVKVNHDMCSFDAFYDEKLRWNMIKNRINYVGGFISSKQILTALNVTRKCKQPSWFSFNYARYIIKKYCQSDTIVDLFAGWGMRHDAAVSLGKSYVGCDLNSELVDWHIAQRRNIVLGDAKEFKYDEDCDVVICPPYKDTEVYFDLQDSDLTQCQWLELVIKNVPNARKYVMVCKVVDPGYEKYIVETKENRSHFGVNTEYVIVVDNSSRSECDNNHT